MMRFTLRAACLALSVIHDLSSWTANALPTDISTPLSKRGNCCSGLKGDEVDPPQRILVVHLNRQVLRDNDCDESQDGDRSSNSLDLDAPSEVSSTVAIQRDDLGDQLPLSKLIEDTPEQFEQQKQLIWRSAYERGEKMRGILDEYVGQKQDRIDDRDFGKEPLVLGEHYTVEDEVISGTLIAKDAAAALKDAKVPAATVEKVINAEFHRSVLRSKIADEVKGLPRLDAVMKLHTSTELGLIVVIHSDAHEDSNTPSTTMFSSELMWQNWEQIAGEDARKRGQDVDQAIRKLKYVVSYNIVNQETRNMVTLCHLAAMGNEHNGVLAVEPYTGPFGSDNDETKAVLGTGHWTPDHPLFNFLLGLPNVRPTAQLLADHNTALDNDYMVGIHTLPLITDSANIVRFATIVMELGPWSQVPGNVFQGTVATS